MNLNSHKFAPVAAVFIASSMLGLAHAEEDKQFFSGLTASSTTPAFLITAQSKFRISDAGNILSFEGPSGYEHIANGDVGEGYVLCYDGKTAYDTGGNQSGFAFPITSCAGNSCTVTRNTLDGRIQLKQVLTGITSERGLSITMTVKNLLASNRLNVILRRQVDFDVDTGGTKGTGSFDNRFATSERDAVFAWNAPNDHVPQEDHALLLKHVSQTPDNFAHFAKTTDLILDTACSPPNITANGPVLGDFGATLQYNIGTLGAGRSAIAKLEYQRN